MTVAELETQPPAPDAAEPDAEPAPAPDSRGMFRRLIDLGFGVVGLLAGLAALAAIPVLQFMTLGWLLEAEGRLGRTGSLRGSLPGLRKAARIGSTVIGWGLLLLPILVLRSYAKDAALIAAGSETAITLANATRLMVFVFGVHGLLATARGGRVRFFLRPFNTLIWFVREGLGKAKPSLIKAALVEAVVGLRLAHYLTLGVKGVVVGVAWLIVPTSLLVLGGKFPPVMLLGIPLMCVMLPYALMAQARLAAENDASAAFELGEVRRRIARSPLVLALALVVTLGLALPLYAFKIEALPRDALWLPALAFLVAAVPGRLLAGWAYHRGAREGRGHWLLRLLGLGVTLPAGFAYVFFVFVNQYFGWSGATGLYAQHAFLVPVAFY